MSPERQDEVFARPLAFLIDERGLTSACGIVSTKQFLGFVLAGAGHKEKDGDGAVETFRGSQAPPADAGESSLSYSKEVDHV